MNALLIQTPAFCRWSSICMLLLFFSSRLSAQTFTLKGSVKDEKGAPVELATVVLNSSLMTLTDKHGQFSLARVPAGTYDYRISFVGNETVTGKLTVRTGRERLDVQMKRLNLELKSVTVTATQSRMGSKSTIGEEAIRHIQPKSLADLLQLVPGNLTVNPNLNNLAQAQIREIGNNANNALGTSVVVDGTPLSNDANLQVLSPTRYGSGSGGQSDGMSDQTTAGRGTDLRTVSADNIESVEVIRGIPSVEYGNLTSGVVLVKTKAGVTPLEVKAKADPFSKLVFAGKGFALKGGGAANFGVDYSQSYGDTRRHYLGYERVTASAGYSNRFGPLSLNVKSAFYSNINSRRNDPQQKEQDLTFTNKNVGGRLSVNGSWLADRRWLTGLDYNLSAQVARTLDKHHNLISNPDGVVTDVSQPGLHEAYFMNKAYYSDYRIEGLPVNVYAQLKANKYIALPGNNFTTVRLGVDYTYDANRGDGLEFDLAAPPQAQGEQTLRPRAYKDIPALQTLSAFLEDRLSVRLAGRPLQVSAGVRLSNLFLDSRKSGGRSNLFVAEPRVNASFTLLDRHNNSWFDELSLTGGFGISNKMPTLLYLYPDKAYFDYVSLSKYGTTEDSRLALLTTDVVSNTQNPNLKPVNSRKWEAGVNFRLGNVKGFITYFNELHRHEYGFASQLLWSHYDKFDVPVEASNVRFDGTDVSYQLNGVHHTASRTEQVMMNTWSRPDNTTRSFKQGIEYMFDLGTWKALRTSLNVDGAWFHIKRTSEKDRINYINKTYDYVPVMPAGSGTVNDRFNTNFRFITHIPAVRMVFTTTLQVVWYESRRNTYEHPDGTVRYHTSEDGSRLIVSPLGFYDKTGTYTPWQPEFETNPTYQLMNGSYLTYAFKKDVIDPWVLLNFRFTKELGRVGEVSFIANNFPNMSKWHTGRYSRSKSQLYPSMYFGAELKLTL